MARRARRLSRRDVSPKRRRLDGEKTDAAEAGANSPADTDEVDVEFSTVEAALQRLAAGEFPKQNRPRVQPDDVKEVKGLSLGLVSRRSTKKEAKLSKGSQLLPGLTRLLCRFMREAHPEEPFTSIQVNYAFASREHVDPFNLGRSWIFGAGDFDGGELWVEDPENGDVEHKCNTEILGPSGIVRYRAGDTYRGRVLEVKNGRWQLFDGRRLHFTRPITRGFRFSVIYYCSSYWELSSEEERAAAKELGFNLPELGTLQTTEDQTFHVMEDNSPAAAAAAASPTLTPLPLPGSTRRKMILWQCEVCTATFPNSSRYHRHIKSHREPDFMCDEEGCGKRFRRKEQLLRHSWSHKDQTARPFACPASGCNKSFADAHGLRRHQLKLHGSDLAVGQ